MRMLAVGLLMSGPSLHLWFNLMSRTFPNPDIWSTVKKVSLGQLVFGPCFNTIFFSVNGYAQGMFKKLNL
jgi:protein Mpv17